MLDLEWDKARARCIMDAFIHIASVQPVLGWKHGK